MSRIVKDYPPKDPDARVPRPTLKTLRKKYWRSWKWYFGSQPDLSHHVLGLEKLAALDAGEIVVMTRQRNGFRFIRSFLRHYRALGAHRFIVIDEKSEDGTPEFLAGESDVITLTAATSYAESGRGKAWFNAVLSRLPKGQKMVIVDNDEYLVFSDGSCPLPHLFAAMTARGLDRLTAMMVDLYPAAPIKDAVFDGTTDRLPWEVARYFDGDGYTMEASWQGLRLKGGVRRRLFGENLFLTKHPVMFNPKRAILDRTVHFPQPLTHNAAVVGGVLLHFKYFSDFVEEHQRIAERGAHNKGAQTYQAVLDLLSGVNVAEEFEFIGDCSQRYSGPAQLCELGLMNDICARS